jgi:1-deoxy-D-xylulose-5-phosphate synthase
MRGRDARCSLLRTLASPPDLRQLPLAQLPQLARELRTLLAERVSTTALERAVESVELAVAVHYALETPHDRLVWDGSQNAQADKLLMQQFAQVRGIRRAQCERSLPRPGESDHGGFEAGHVSTSISAALGMAIAAGRIGKPRRVVAIISAEALTGGMAFEALNHAGSLTTDLLVILMDSDPLGRAGHSAVRNHFARLLCGRPYARLREGGKKALARLPTVRELARRSELHLKGMLLPGSLFEELGFNYIGPCDGHDVRSLVVTLRNVRRLRGPQLLHVVTKSRKRDSTALAAPRLALDAGFMSLHARQRPPEPTSSYSQVCAQWLCDMASGDSRFCLVTPAMRHESGLHVFARRFPDRCFDVSASQQHAVTFAAGLTTAGLKPIVVISSTLLQRVYDQLIHDVALQKLAVTFAVEQAGLVGGPAQQGSYDLCFLRCIPNFTVMTPADHDECRQMLYAASSLPGPAVVRYPSGLGPSTPVTSRISPLPIGRAKVCREGGSGLGLLVFGSLLDAARHVATQMDATLVNMRFVKPLDRTLLAQLGHSHRALVTIEDNAITGGAGSAVIEALSAGGLHPPLLQLGIPDRFIGYDSRADCLVAMGLDPDGLLDRIARWWSFHASQRAPSAASG